MPRRRLGLEISGKVPLSKNRQFGSKNFFAPPFRRSTCRQFRILTPGPFVEVKSGHFTRGVLQIRPFFDRKSPFRSRRLPNLAPRASSRARPPDFWKTNPVRNLSLVVVVQHHESTFFGRSKGPPPVWGRQFDSFAFLTHGPLWRSKVAI